jgi:hypothetical protein
MLPVNRCLFRSCVHCVNVGAHFQRTNWKRIVLPLVQDDIHFGDARKIGIDCVQHNEPVSPWASFYSEQSRMCVTHLSQENVLKSTCARFHVSDWQVHSELRPQRLVSPAGFVCKGRGYPMWSKYETASLTGPI